MSASRIGKAFSGQAFLRSYVLTGRIGRWPVVCSSMIKSCGAYAYAAKRYVAKEQDMPEMEHKRPSHKERPHLPDAKRSQA